MTSFAALFAAHLEEAIERDPLFATRIGRHDHDDRWPDLSAAARRSTVAWLDGWTARFAALDPADLTADETIDRDRLRLAFEAQRFELTELRADAWDPLGWIFLMGDGLFGLVAREFAPPEVRLAAMAGRLERLGAVIDAAIESLGSVPGLVVSRLSTERALQDLGGIGALIEEAQALAGTLEASPATDALRGRLAASADAARASMARFEAHLREVVLPVSVGEGRLGRDRFEAKLRHTVSDPDLSVERIVETAERQYAAVRAEMARIATDWWPASRPGEPLPADPDEVIRAALHRIAADHPPADRLLDTCREALVRIEVFCRERGLIGLAEEPLDIIWTPVFLRGWAGAMLSSPGPFDIGQKAFFCVTPAPEEWTDDLRESYLREMNRPQLDVLTIHEAVPGHYLQGVYGNRAVSPVRPIYGDGMYAEGWAVYVTQVMLDAGYRAGDPAFALAHWKYYLRCLVNAIIDIRIHCEDMSEERALDLMMRGAFQEQGEAVAKYRRARLTSTQLCTYFVGSLGFWDIEAEARRRAAVAAAGGDPSAAASIPEPAIVGGYGPTPGFDQRAHLEAVIAGGDLPLPLLRRATLGA